MNLPLDVCVPFFATECMDEDEAGKYDIVRSLSVSFFIEKELCKQLRMKRKRKGER
jgi:hypothetical protein